jgi:hypothetical protein
MKKVSKLLTALVLVPLVANAADTGDLAIARNQYCLKGTISDADDHPLPAVRVGMRSVRASTTTDSNGHFILSFSNRYLPNPDKNKPYDCVEIDKDAYLGQAFEVRDLSFFDKPLVAKLKLNPLTEDWAEFSRRMSVNYILPHGTPRPPKDFSLISDDEWKKTLASIEGMGQEGPTEQVFFQAYVPKKAAGLKAVFLISRHGMGTIDHPKLREFADCSGVALVSVLGNSVQRGCYPVSAIDEDIDRLGQLLHHPELSKLPFFTFGHSNGTGFSALFASQRPDRAIAWISYHSGASFHLQFPGVEKVPGLAMHGQIDPFSHNGQEQTIKNLRKERNAPIALMMEGNVAHGPVDRDKNATWAFIIQFCEAAMRIRLNPDGTLRPVVIEQGWLGANYDRSQGGQQELAIAPYVEFKGDRSIANWLPDRQFAEVWQRYGKTDPRPVK